MPITSSFTYHSTALEVARGHDLRGRHALVTGGASGIGVETVRALASCGADVTVAVRNVADGAEVVAELQSLYPDAALHLLELDLGSLASIDAATQAFLERGVALDILINNAGVMATPFERTSDGFELQFGTNHLGHFALTTSLLPALRRAQGARVVALSSSAHRRSDLHRDDPNYLHRPYEKWESYGQSKTANALFAVGLTNRFSAEGIFSNSVMPGGILTGLQRHMSPEDQLAAGFISEDGTPNPLFKSTAQGASTSVWAALAPELDGVGGLYLENCAQAGLMDPAVPYLGYMPYALDADSADFLWELSTSLVSH